MSSIRTYYSGRFDFLNPLPEQIDIRDIGLSLSREPRFSGQTNPDRAAYTVAQHSWIMSHIVPPDYALEALLHDGHEAYCRDIPSPFKRLLPDYKFFEAKIDEVIRTKWNLPSDMSEIVHEADGRMLCTEQVFLFHGAKVAEGVRFPNFKPFDASTVKPHWVSSWTEQTARTNFMERFHEITGFDFKVNQTPSIRNI